MVRTKSTLFKSILGRVMPVTLLVETVSWGKALNVSGAPWFNSNREIDEVFDHVEDITEINNYEQTFSVNGGNDKTTFYSSMSQNYERAHWQTFDEYRETVSTTFGHQPTRKVPSDFMKNLQD